MRRIQTKITFTYVLLTLLAISAFTVVASLATQSYLTKQKISELSKRIDILAPLLKPDTGDLLSTVDRHIRNLAVAMDLRITLLDADGVVLIDSDVSLDEISIVENPLHRPEIQQALGGRVGTDTRKSATVNQELLYVARIYRVPDAVGILQKVKFIRLSANLEDIRTMANEERLNILLAGIVVLLLVVGVSVVISRRIANPMVQIADAVEQIRAGNLDTRISVTGDDEVGRVGQVVNEMVDKLKTDIVQLKKLERVRSEFLGNVSHELRTPIFSLQGFLETLIEGAIDDPTVNRVFLQKAYNHSARLNTLLGELITISQIESGEMKMSFRYFNLKELLSTLVEELRPTAEHNNVALHLADGPPSDVEVLGDKERLSVALENLFENAIKYNKPGGEVIVSFTRQTGKAIVRIADTGVGISPEHQPRIFERFYRVDRNRSREVGGTGLGLAIVKHIIEAHGSAVHVESDLGKGSVFSFALSTL